MFNSIFKQPKISLEKIFPFIDHIEVWAIFVKEVFLYREQSGNIQGTKSMKYFT